MAHWLRHGTFTEQTSLTVTHVSYWWCQEGIQPTLLPSTSKSHFTLQTWARPSFHNVRGLV